MSVQNLGRVVGPEVVANEVKAEVELIKANIAPPTVYGPSAFTVDQGTPGYRWTAKIPVNEGDEIKVSAYSNYQKLDFFDPDDVKTEHGDEGDFQGELKVFDFTAPSNGWVQGVSYIGGAQDFEMVITSLSSQLYATPNDLTEVSLTVDALTERVDDVEESNETNTEIIASILNNVVTTKIYGPSAFTVDQGTPGYRWTAKIPVNEGMVIKVAAYSNYQKLEFFDESDVKTEYGSDGSFQGELKTVELTAPSNGSVKGVSYVSGEQDFYMQIDGVSEKLYATEQDILDSIGVPGGSAAFESVDLISEELDKIKNNIPPIEVYDASNFTVPADSPGYLYTPKFDVQTGDKITIGSYTDYQKGEFFNTLNVKTEFGAEGSHQGELKVFEYICPSDGEVRAVSYNNVAADFYMEIERAGKLYATPQDLKELSLSLFEVGNKFEMAAPKTMIRFDFTTPSELPDSKADGKIYGEIIMQTGNLKFKKYASFEVQGSSSEFYPKKNFTIGFFNDVARTSKFNLRINNTIFLDEWVYKAHWIDATMVRNIVANRIWSQFEQARPGLRKRDIDQFYIGKTGAAKFDTGATGIVDGFPCEMYINGVFYGIGMFNSGKKVGNYNLTKSNPNHVQIETDQRQMDFYTMTLAAGDYAYRSPTVITGAETKIADFKAFAALPQADFTAAIFGIMDTRNLIDYYIFVQCLFLADNTANNIMLTRWQDKFLFFPYDLDNAFGLHFAGESIYPTNQDAFQYRTDVPANTRAFWEKVRVALANQLENRYIELKYKGVINPDNILNLYNELSFVFGQERYAAEFTKWALPSEEITDANQIYTWFTDRIAWLDGFFI